MRFPGYRAIILRALCMFVALAPLVAGSASGASVIKCVAADGSVAFQATPCAADQRQSEVVLVPPPPAGPASAYAVEAPHRQQNRRVSHRSIAKRKPPMSWECRAADGQVFYRHKRCPGSVPTDGQGESRSGVPFSRRGKRVRVTVAAKPLLREDACRRIHSGGSTARRGHDNDEDVSAYDHNLGRDPCL